MRRWVDGLRDLSSRQARRYATLEEAWQRMQEANPHLTPVQARHLTVHGTLRNEDGTYSWKFDNYVRAGSPYFFNVQEMHEIWSLIACPTLLIRGTESWETDPEQDGRAAHFRSARTINIAGAGHWVYHDQFAPFMAEIRSFLAEDDQSRFGE